MHKKKTRRPVTMKLELGGESGGCTEAAAKVDAEGRLLLPEEFRKNAGLKPGDELQVFAVAGEGGACCVAVAGRGGRPSRLKVTCCEPEK